MKEVRRMLTAKILSKQTPPFSCQSRCHNPSFHSRPLTLRTLKPQPWPCSSFTAAETSVCGFLCLWRHWPESVSRPSAHSVNTHTLCIHLSSRPSPLTSQILPYHRSELSCQSPFGTAPSLSKATSCAREDTLNFTAASLKYLGLWLSHLTSASSFSDHSQVSRLSQWHRGRDCSQVDVHMKCLLIGAVFKAAEWRGYVVFMFHLFIILVCYTVCEHVWNIPPDFLATNYN